MVNFKLLNFVILTYMDNKIETAKGLFSWIEDKVATPIGAGLLCVLMTSAAWYVFSNERVDNLKNQINFFEKENDEVKIEIKALKNQIITADNECANRFIFMSKAIEELQRGTANAKEISDKLTIKEKKSNEELKEINKKLNSKL